MCIRDRDLSGYWYYLDNNTGEMKTGLQEINGYKYYLDESGYMRTGWVLSLIHIYLYNEVKGGINE